MDLFPIKLHICYYTQNTAYVSSLHLWTQDSRDTCKFLFRHTLLEWRAFLKSVSFGVGARVKYHDGGENCDSRTLKRLFMIMIMKKEARR